MDWLGSVISAFTIGPPVPGQGPILNIGLTPDGILASRQIEDGQIIAFYLLRHESGEWERIMVH